MQGMDFRALYAEVEDRPAPERRVVWEAVELILREEVESLEGQLCGLVGAPRCAVVSDPASGIALALRAAGVEPGDSVMCTLLGCAAPVQGVLLAGAAPVFADMNPNTYTVDPFCLEYAVGKLVRDGQPAPKALIATDLFGAPCDFPALGELCARFGMALIEDMSGAFGASLGGVPCGNFGRFSVASLADQAPLDELGGAAVFCRSQADWNTLDALRQSGTQQALEKSDQPLPRLGSVDLCVAKSKLEQLEAELDQRRKVADCYREALAGKLRVQQLPQESKSACSQMVAVLPDPDMRQGVIAALAAKSIPCAVPQPVRELVYSAWNRVMLINSMSVGDRLISLPIHPYLGAHIVEYICNNLLEAVEARRKG